MAGVEDHLLVLSKLTARWLSGGHSVEELARSTQAELPRLY